MTTSVLRNQTSRHHGSPKDNNKKVQFDSLTIKEFPLVPGHTVPTEGVPVSIGSTPINSIVISVDKFESFRPPRREVMALRLDPETRSKLLFLAGYSFTDIADSATGAQIIRRSRDETIIDLRNQDKGYRWAREGPTFDTRTKKGGMRKRILSTGKTMKNMIFPHRRGTD